MTSPPEARGASLSPAWRQILGPTPAPWAERLLRQVAGARSLSLALDELPWAPPGGVGLVHVALRFQGVPGLGAREALARTLAAAAAWRTAPVAVLHAVRLGTEGGEALAAFLADAREDLEAGAPGLPAGGSLLVQVPAVPEGFTLDLFALSAEGGLTPRGLDLEPGDALVPTTGGDRPAGTLGWLPLGGRPWWDLVLSLARDAGLGVRTECSGEGDGLAWVRGAGQGPGARVLSEPRLELVSPEGALCLPMALLEAPPFEPGSGPSPVPDPAVPSAPDFVAPNLMALVRRAEPPPQAGGLLHPWPGAAEVAGLPGEARALAWALASVEAPADPFWGLAEGVSRLALRLACVGAAPLGLAVAFHVGDPGRAGLTRAMEDAALGLRQACLALDLPVLNAGLRSTAGADLGAVLLAVGDLDDPAPPLEVEAPDATALTQVGHRTAPLAFRAPADGLFLLGEATGELDAVYRVAACVREGVRLGLLRSAQVLGRDGLLGAVLLGAQAGRLGAQLLLEAGEPTLRDCAPGAVLASLSVAAEGGLEALGSAHGVPFRKVGVTGGTRVALAVGGRPVLDVGLDELPSSGA